MKKLLHILILALALTMLAAPALAEQPTATAYKATEPIVIEATLTTGTLPPRSLSTRRSRPSAT